METRDEWRKSNFIEGARRIGKKVPLHRNLLKNEYDSYILIDFAKKDKEVELYFEKFLNDMNTLL